jgi:chromate reductase
VRPKVMAFAGSARRDSFNKKLVRVAVRGVESAGVECSYVDLADHRLPVYDGDLEAKEGQPAAAARLRELLHGHQAFLISTPEYNGAIPPLLKNTIDWATRSPEANPDLTPFQGKIGALMSASPGPLGGMRALADTRVLLTNLGVSVLSDSFSLRKAYAAFDDAGQLSNEGQAQLAEGLGRKLAEWLLALKAQP